jgi:hypothetical protein
MLFEGWNFARARNFKFVAPGCVIGRRSKARPVSIRSLDNCIEPDITRLSVAVLNERRLDQGNQLGGRANYQLSPSTRALHLFRRAAKIIT